MRKITILLVLFVSLPCLTMADDAEVKVGGQMFLHYDYNISGYENDDPRAVDNDANAFDLARARLNVFGILPGNMGGRLTLDGRRSADDEDMVATIRYAYLAWAPKPIFHLKFGLFEEPWDELLEKRCRFRILGRTMGSTYTWGDTAEMGLNAGGLFPRNFGGFSLWVGNGQGAHSAEVDRGKAASAMVYLTPLQSTSALADVGLAGVFRYDNGEDLSGPSMDTRMLYGGMFFAKISRFNLGFEYLRTSQEYNEDEDPIIAHGYHVFGDVMLTQQFGLLARWMHWDANTANDREALSNRQSILMTDALLPQDEDGVDWLTAGVFYFVNAYVRLFAYYRTEWYEETDEEDKTIDAEQIVGAATEIRF